MERQKTGWGYIDWLVQEQDSSGLALNVGIVTIDPHAHMDAHVHYAEQVVYILKGTGHSFIDGQRIDMPAGSMYHWKAGVIHEMFNTGNTVFEHIMVSNPSGVDIDKIIAIDKGEAKQAGLDSGRLLYAAVEGIRTQFLDTMHYACNIFDSKGNLVSKSRFFPAYCRLNCAEVLSAGMAPCLLPNSSWIGQSEYNFRCPHRFTVYTVPILFGGMYLGYVQGGYIFHSEMAAEYLEGVYDTPQSTVEGIIALLRRIAKAIVNFCEFASFKSELLEKDTALADERHSHELLMADLKNAKYAMTDLKLNNHFLFNTLNQMASMAIEGGLMPLYQSILDLSKMFHYSLRTKGNMVALDKEFDYLKAYLKLQKLRYGDGLTVHYEIDCNLEKWMVPFNFLMPIAENAFIHGFANEENKRLDIRIHENGGSVEFCIRNNGTVLDEETCRTINLGMRSDTAHGLTLVYSKLSAIYGGDFSLEILPDRGNGASCRLLLPAGQPMEASL